MSLLTRWVSVEVISKNKKQYVPIRGIKINQGLSFRNILHSLSSSAMITLPSGGDDPEVILFKTSEPDDLVGCPIFDAMDESAFELLGTFSKKHIRFVFPSVLPSAPRPDAFALMMSDSQCKTHLPAAKTIIKTALDRMYNDFREHLQTEGLGWSRDDAPIMGHKFLSQVSKALFYTDPHRDHFKTRGRTLPCLLPHQEVYNVPARHGHTAPKKQLIIQAHADDILSLLFHPWKPWLKVGAFMQIFYDCLQAEAT